MLVDNLTPNQGCCWDVRKIATRSGHYRLHGKRMEKSKGVDLRERHKTDCGTEQSP